VTVTASALDKMLTDASFANKIAFAPEIAVDLGRILAHNDSGVGKPIYVAQARQYLLEAHGWSIGDSAFRDRIRAHFGRTWGGK